MEQRPVSYRVRSGGGPGALLSVVVFVLVVGSVGAAGWLGGSPERGGSGSASSLGTASTGLEGSAGRGSSGAQGIGGQPAESPNFTSLPISRIVGDVEVSEPTPGGTVPGTGFLLFAGRVLSYSPDQIEARLKIPGRPDAVASIDDVRDGAFSGWLIVSPPSGTVDAVLEIYDGALHLAAARPALARIGFRIGPETVVTVSNPYPTEAITTSDLLVDGTSAPWVENVAVRLEGAGHRVVATVVVSTVAVPVRPPTPERRRFELRLKLPAPRPLGTMYVEVFPADGMPIPDRYRVRMEIEIGSIGG